MTLQEQASVTSVEPCSYVERHLLLTQITSSMQSYGVKHTNQLDTLRLVYLLKQGLVLAAQFGIQITDGELLNSELQAGGTEDDITFYITDLLDTLMAREYITYCQYVYTELFLRDNAIRMKLPELFGYIPNNNYEKA